MKKTTKLLFVALGMLVGTYARAQLDIPASSISLQYPGVSAVTLTIGATVENVRPTPFLIAGAAGQGRSWLCMDPLQRIYYDGSGLPAATLIHYASTNPTDFDLWNPSAPGLTTARIQDLADLFKAHWPAVDTALTDGALQLAVWEIANEFTGNPYDLSAGAFKASNNASMIALAQSFLNSLSTLGVQDVGNPAGLSFLIDGTTTISNKLTLVQDLVSWDDTGLPLTPVPEPSTYGIAAALGLGLISAIRRRRVRARA